MNIRVAIITLFFALLFGAVDMHAQGSVTIEGEIQLSPYPFTDDGS